MQELIMIQSELKAPKNQRNTFGNYNYRNCEDILEAVKPLLAKNNCILKLTDDIVLIGDRFYVKATATVSNCEGKSESVTAFARESLDKKGMDASQITGATSSYARKYALNGLFCIDDTKDADATNTHDKEEKQAPIMSQINPKVKAETMKKLLIFARKQKDYTNLEVKDLPNFYNNLTGENLKTCTEDEIIEAMK
jgi:hypothetical protein